MIKRYNIIKKSKHRSSKVCDIFQKKGIYSQNIYTFVGIKLLMWLCSLSYTSHYWDTNEMFPNTYRP